MSEGKPRQEPDVSSRQERWLRLLPWLALVIACLPLLGGFPKGHDWLYELVRVAEYMAALGAGQLPPYWGENLYGGYGSPVFLFYAPLFCAAASLLAWLVDSVAWGSSALLVALTAIGMIATRKMAAAAVETGDAAAARVGTYVYLLHPYLLGDKFVRNANSEFAALCLAPLVLLAVLQAGTRPRAAFVCLSLGLAATILAHNLTALLAMGLVVAGALALYPARSATRSWGVIGAGVAFGLALSAFFWVPAMWLMPLVRTEELLTGKFDFHSQFPLLGEVFGYERFFATGWLTPVLLLVGCWIAFTRLSARGRQRRLLVAALAACLGLIFLMTPASTLLWESVPLLPLFQFPWRLLGALALLLAPIAALSFAHGFAGVDHRLRLWAEIAIFAVCAINALPRLQQYQSLEPRLAHQLPQLLAPEAVRQGRRSVTVGDEYLPRAADRRAWSRQRPTRGPIVGVSTPAQIEIIRDAGSQIELRVTTSIESRLSLARWAFPGWRLELNGRPSEPLANAAGSLEVRVPAGTAHVQLRYEPPPVRKLCLGISLGALAFWLALCLASTREPFSSLLDEALPRDEPL